jgi:hypothetical protein
MFKQVFNDEANKYLTGVTIGEAPCDRGIQTVKPTYDIFGICFEFSCKCD